MATKKKSAKRSKKVFYPKELFIQTDATQSEGSVLDSLNDRAVLSPFLKKIVQSVKDKFEESDGDIKYYSDKLKSTAPSYYSEEEKKRYEQDVKKRYPSRIEDAKQVRGTTVIVQYKVVKVIKVTDDFIVKASKKKAVRKKK